MGRYQCYNVELSTSASLKLGTSYAPQFKKIQSSSLRKVYVIPILVWYVNLPIFSLCYFNCYIFVQTRLVYHWWLWTISLFNQRCVIHLFLTVGSFRKEKFNFNAKEKSWATRFEVIIYHCCLSFFKFCYATYPQ